MNIVLLCNRSKPEVDQVAEIIASFGNVVTLSDKVPEVEFFSQFDLGVSYFYRHILKPEHIKAVRMGLINCHISLLPRGRGADPAVWSIVNKFPAGVTMHWIDAGIDTGPIIAQMETNKFNTDTWETLYNRLSRDMLDLFKMAWPVLEKFRFTTNLKSQSREGWMNHRKSDALALDDLAARFGPTLAHDFVDVLRARTFPGKPSAYLFDHTDGKKIYVRVTLEKEA